MVVQNSLRKGHFGARGHLRRPRLFRLRGWIRVCARPGGKAPLPSKDLELWKPRSTLKGRLADSHQDRFTSFAHWDNSNASDQEITLPLKMHWIRRFEGSAKQFSSFGGGRMYTHTAEGQVFAVEQETGRLLWRRYFPGVHISYTSPLYYQGRLLVPQAGLEQCRLQMPGGRHREPLVGSPLRRFAKLEPPVAARGLQKPRDLHVRHGQIRRRRAGERAG